MTLRQHNITRLREGHFDVIIVGGGINGAVSAAALAAKGVKVALVDKGDFAAETSSQSSNLVWGGVKYLETHEYRLVNKLCKARNQLMSRFPSRVSEIRFLTTIQKGFRFRPSVLYLGTLLYWAFGRFFTRPPRYIRTSTIAVTEPVINTGASIGGFEYSDAYLRDNDARFVFDFVRSALDSGAVAANYVEVISAHRSGEHWSLTLEDKVSRENVKVDAKVVINACGPFADMFNQHVGEKTRHRHLLSKGVHLIVDRVTPSDKVLAFFAADGRLFFVLPMEHKTCIGTTDTRVNTPTPDVCEDDRRFILDNANRLLNLKQPITEKDIIAERCGVRPLAVEGGDSERDWVALSRKHAIDVDTDRQYLSIFGGKLTDCVNVGEEIVDHLEAMGVNIPNPSANWYGESSRQKRSEFYLRAARLGLADKKCENVKEKITERLWRRYGERAHLVLDTIETEPDTLDNIMSGVDFYACELPLVAETEMVTHLEDFLRRRTNISLLKRQEDLVNDYQLKKICKSLFEDDWQQEYDRYCR